MLTQRSRRIRRRFWRQLCMCLCHISNFKLQ